MVELFGECVAFDLLRCADQMRPKWDGLEDETGRLFGSFLICFFFIGLIRARATAKNILMDK